MPRLGDPVLNRLAVLPFDPRCVGINGNERRVVRQIVGLIDLVFAVDGELQHLAEDQYYCRLLGDVKPSVGCCYIMSLS